MTPGDPETSRLSGEHLQLEPGVRKGAQALNQRLLSLCLPHLGLGLVSGKAPWMLVCTDVTAGELAKYFSKVKASAEAQAHHSYPFI